MPYPNIRKCIPTRRGGFQTRPCVIQTRPCVIQTRPKGVEQDNNPVYMVRHHHKRVQ